MHTVIMTIKLSESDRSLQSADDLTLLQFLIPNDNKQERHEKNDSHGLFVEDRHRG